MFGFVVALLSLFVLGFVFFRLARLDVFFSGVALKISSSYFLGLIFFISFFRVFCLFAAPSHAVIFILVFSFLGGVLFRKPLFDLIVQVWEQRRIAFSVLFWSVWIAFFLLWYWLPLSALLDDPFAIVGSLHSVRYAWVANYIAAFDYIPKISQNTGQSFLVFFSGFFEARPLLHLFLFLMVSVFSLGAFVYGVLRKYGCLRRDAFWGCLVFIFGSSSLSLAHVMVVDSGFPFFVDGYTDVMVGAFLVIFLFLINDILNKENWMRVWVGCLFGLITCFFVAPQNIVILSSVVVLSAVIFRQSILHHSFKYIFWGSLLLVSFGVAIPLGGMLTPRSLLEDVAYYGVMSFQKSLSIHAVFEAGLPYRIGWMGQWASGNYMDTALLNNALTDPRLFFLHIFWYLESLLIIGGRLLFFPVLGIFAYFWIDKKSIFVLGCDQELPTHWLHWGRYALGLLFLGGCMPFFLSLNGYKWELSRFLLPGIVIGMFGVALLVAYFLNRDGVQKIFPVGFLLIFLLFGPLTNFVATAIRNFNDLAQSDRLGETWDVFVGVGPPVERQPLKKRKPLSSEKTGAVDPSGQQSVN